MHKLIYTLIMLIAWQSTYVLAQSAATSAPNASTSLSQSETKLGLKAQDLTVDFVNMLELKNSNGAMINFIQEGSPAEIAKLQVLDVITALDGEPVNSDADLTKLLAVRNLGQSVTLSINRRGTKSDAKLLLGIRRDQLAELKRADAKKPPAMWQPWLAEFSGVWNSPQYGSLQIYFTQSRMRIKGEYFRGRVEVLDIDRNNEALTFNLFISAFESRNEMSKPTEWTLRRVWNRDRSSFWVSMFAEGGREDWDYVRRLLPNEEAALKTD